jgi:hypothetical protein
MPNFMIQMSLWEARQRYPKGTKNKTANNGDDDVCDGRVCEREKAREELYTKQTLDRERRESADHDVAAPQKSVSAGGVCAVCCMSTVDS